MSQTAVQPPSPSKASKTMNSKSLLSSSTIDRSLSQCQDKIETTVSRSESESSKKTKAEEICLQQGVYGIVKWYNVKFRYGFIKRLDTQEDVFVHKNGIKRSSPNKAKSIGDGEVVFFDIFQAAKGPEARNVTGPEGKPARASRYARIIRFFNPQYIPQYPRRYNQAYRKPVRNFMRPNFRRNLKDVKSNEEKYSAPKNSVNEKIEPLVEAKNVVNSKTSALDSTPIISSNYDENSSKNNKESGYISKEEKTTSSSVVLEKQSNPTKKGRRSKKVIYIIKDQRESSTLDACAIREAIQKNVGACTCTQIH